MSDALAVEALLKKRAELATQIQGLQSAVFHIDASLALLGFKPGMRTVRRFANGELIAMVGEAERAGNQTPTAIVRYIMAAKGWDATDGKLTARVMFSVKDCRKRLNARGA